MSIPCYSCGDPLPDDADIFCAQCALVIDHRADVDPRIKVFAVEALILLGILYLWSTLLTNY